MNEALSRYDQWIQHPNSPAAIVIREYLMPVDGIDGILFPPTFASGDGFAGGYNIDYFHGDKSGENVCLIDSVGAQANRIEPIFCQDEYRGLIPQVTVKAGEREVSILEAGHRAGDALVRCSELQSDLQSAFKNLLIGNAVPLAKLAPTSLVFGVWDSRDTQAKLPRVVSSTIRAFDVRKLTRSAVYTPPVNYAELEVFSESEKAKAEGQGKSPLAQRGFVHNPASNSHGGVIAEGGIRRDATLSLAAIQLLRAGDDEEQTLALRRYILGLSMVAFTSHVSSYLRQGCMLVLNPEKERRCDIVYPDGRRDAAELSHAMALEFAREAATKFEVGEDRKVEFDKAKAKNDVKKKD